MKFNCKHLFSLVFCTGISTLVFAQTAEPEMADALRQDGKIWVVVSSLLVMFGGLALYLIRLERKLTKLEKQQKGHEN